MVKTVENQMATDLTLNHEYLPVAGLPAFRTAACALVLGKDNPAILQNRVSFFGMGVEGRVDTTAFSACMDSRG